MKKKLCLTFRPEIEPFLVEEMLMAGENYTIEQGGIVAETGEIVVRGQKCYLKRKFRRQIFKPHGGGRGFAPELIAGAVSGENFLLRQFDLYLPYNEKRTGKIKEMVRSLSEAASVVLTEPDIYVRAAQVLSGQGMPAAGTGNVRLGDSVGVHLLWQIYPLSLGWAELAEKKAERMSVRRLRVRIRRLRSCFSFFNPVLKKEEAGVWRQVLRAQGLLLAHLRELDVLLMMLESIKESFAGNGQEFPLMGMEKHLRELRNKCAADLLTQVSPAELNGAIAGLIMWLEGQPITVEAVKLNPDKFMRSRMRAWAAEVAELADRKADFTDMTKLHRFRIKVKKLRYVLLSLPEFTAGSGQFLRLLKRMQDTIGYLHDEYVNRRLVAEACAGESDALLLEQAAFHGWESAKAAQAFALLPDLRRDFAKELKLWQKTL